MYTLLRSSFLVLSFSLLSNNCWGDDRSQDNPLSYGKAYDEFMQMDADPGKGATVSHLVLQRDVATFTLEDGTLFLCRPILGQACAAIFHGHGSFSYTPPTDIEQEQLNRYYEKRSLNDRFTVLFLMFADSTLDELTSRLSFIPQAPPKRSQDELNRYLKYVSDDDGKYFDPEIMQTFLQHQRNGLFYAQFYGGLESPFIFEINPYDEEQVSLSRRSEGRSWKHDAEIINQFPWQKAPMKDNEFKKKTIKVEKYTLDCTIQDNLKFVTRADMGFTSLTGNQQWIYFNLYSALQVDSVLWSNGKRCEFFSEGKNPVLWLKCVPSLQQDQACSVHVYYHGELLKKVEELSWITLQSASQWYPRYDYRAKANFDITFHTPARYRFVCVGENVATSTEGDVQSSHWISRGPMRNASFNIGFFDTLSVRNEKIPPVDILVNSTGHHEISSALAENMVFSGKDMDQQVGVDIENSILFYQTVFGKCPMNKLTATEIPYEHGEAFPGLLHLSWTTFQITDDKGSNELFRAHEVAHQWWGIGVDFKTYHDQWLSEGFAEYSALWYLEAKEKGNKKFFDVLKKWKERILSNRKYIFGSGQEAGPISLGYRTQSSSTKGDYDLIIYEKGAWVLHMLRQMMINLQSMNEDKFKGMMQDFYSTNLDKSASTQDFRKTVEKNMGLNMEWFFKQWVDGTAIPKYKFAFKASRTEDGKYTVRCRVRQLEVADDFQMVVPMYIDFGGGKFARLRAVVKGPLTEFDLPVLPLKPEKIIFNDLESVLCEVDDVDWDE